MKYLLALAATMTLAAGGVSAADTGNHGYQLMAEAEARDEGWQDSEAGMRMVIRRGDGREVVRLVRSKALEGASGEDKSLSIFDEPLDVRGTVFLTHNYPDKPDQQWIYLPSQKRVKRISSKGQTGRFMGSEFTYEDMAAFSLQKNEYRYIGEEDCGEPLQPCHVIESRSRNEDSGYERVLNWIDKKELRTWQVQMFSKRTGRHSKTLTVSGYKKYLNKFWRPDKLTMRNEKSGAVTELIWEDQQLGVGLSESEFRSSALNRFK